MDVSLVIDNEPVAAASGRRFERRNPVSHDVVTQAAAAGVPDAARAAASAAHAFKSWAQSAPSERRRMLLAAADRLEAKREDFRTTMAGEVGASALWADFNVMGSAALLREAAGLVTQAQGATIPTDKPGTLSMTFGSRSVLF